MSPEMLVGHGEGWKLLAAVRRELADTITSIDQRMRVVAELGEYQRWCSEVARFSFSGGELVPRGPDPPTSARREQTHRRSAVGMLRLGRTVTTGGAASSLRSRPADSPSAEK